MSAREIRYAGGSDGGIMEAAFRRTLREIGFPASDVEDEVERIRSTPGAVGVVVRPKESNRQQTRALTILERRGEREDAKHEESHAGIGRG